MTEEFSGDIMSCTGMMLVVQIDGLNSFNAIFEIRKCQQPISRRQDIAETSFLGDHWAPGCQVGGSPVTEPAAPQANVLVLGHREFSAGIGNVFPVEV